MISFIYICCNNIFIKLNVLTDNPAFLDAEIGNSYGIDRVYQWKDIFISLKSAILFQRSQKICGAVWFLATLFFVEIIYWGIEYLCKRIASKNFSFVFDTILLIIYGISVHFTLNNIIDTSGYHVNQIGLSLLLFHMGSKLRNYDKTTKVNPLFLCFVSISIMYIIKILKLEGIRYARADIKSGVYLLVCSMAGWFFLYGISEILLSNDSILAQFFVYLGKHTLFILLLHQFAFKVITFIQVCFYHEPEYMLAAFPVLYSTKGWWIAYTIIGIVVPLSIEKVLHYCMTKISKNELLSNK